MDVVICMYMQAALVMQKFSIFLFLSLLIRFSIAPWHNKGKFIYKIK